MTQVMTSLGLREGRGMAAKAPPRGEGLAMGTVATLAEALGEATGKGVAVTWGFTAASLEARGLYELRGSLGGEALKSVCWRGLPGNERSPDSGMSANVQAVSEER